MATTFDEQVMPRRRREDRVLEMVGGGSLTKAIGGAVAVALAILGLAHVYPYVTLSLATIAVGVALLFEGGTIAARYERILHTAEGQAEHIQLGGGTTSEFLGGAAGIVLGIIGVLGVAPFTLTAVASIVYGASLLFGSSVPSRLAAITRPGMEETSKIAAAVREASLAASGTQTLVGVAAIVLGILALAGVRPVAVITLVALLGLGFSVLLTGTTVSSKLMNVFRR